MFDKEKLCSELAAYIVDEVASRRPEAPLTLDFAIIEGGLVDSLGLFKLVSFVEEHYSVQIAPDEILFENFASIGDIIRLIESKPSTQAAPNSVNNPT